jgi:hypothetical protein
VALIPAVQIVVSDISRGAGAMSMRLAISKTFHVFDQAMYQIMPMTLHEDRAANPHGGRPGAFTY